MSDTLLSLGGSGDCDIFICGLWDDEAAALVWILIIVSVGQCCNAFVRKKLQDVMETRSEGWWDELS